MYWEEFVLRLFIFDVFCQGIRPPGDKLKSQVTEAGGCKTGLQPEEDEDEKTMFGWIRFVLIVT